MKELKLSATTAIPVPSPANRLTITHEWGDIVWSGSVATSFNFLPDSIGVHTFRWFNVATLVKTDTYEVVNPYVNDTDFFTDYPEWSTEGAQFDGNERRVRRIIDSYVKQSFGPYVSKTIKLQGDGGDSLFLPHRIVSLNSITDSFENDLTAQVEISQEYFIRRAPLNFNYYTVGPSSAIYDVDIKHDITRDIRNFFTDSLDFIIDGDWGWLWVPQDVTEAASLLMNDVYSGFLDERNKRYMAAQLGDFKYEYGRFENPDASTGNVQADMLLAQYVDIFIGLA